MIEHVLKTSLEKGWIITIIYQKGEELTERNIKVLENTKDKVKAFCYLRNETRVFKKANILSAALGKNRSLKMYHTKDSVCI